VLTASLPVQPVPLKLQHYGALQMYYYQFYYINLRHCYLVSLLQEGATLVCSIRSVL